MNTAPKDLRAAAPQRGRGALTILIALLSVVAAARLHADDAESARLVRVLRLRPGAIVADVGAGDGDWTVELARHVGHTGRVYATEVDQDKVDRIGQRMSDEGVENVVTLLGDQEQTGLPADCCDAVLLRLVYHHFTDPAPMQANLARALRPGGRLVIVDTAPEHGWRNLPGVPDRGGHGIEIDDLVGEMSAAGFRLVERHEDWPDEEAEYCLAFETAPGPAATAATRP